MAELAGLSVRTVQRIENGSSPSTETLKSLASVFEIEFTTLLPSADATENNAPPNSPMNTFTPNMPLHYDPKHPFMQGISPEEAVALRQVRKLRGFYTHLMTYALVISGLALLNWYTSPHKWWVLYTAFGWGVGLAFHGFGAFFKPIFLVQSGRNAKSKRS